MFNKAVATLGILADFVSLISDLSLAWKGQVNATNAQQLGMTVADVESARTAFGIAFGSIRIIREFGAQLLAYLGSGKINNAGLLQLSTSWSILEVYLYLLILYSPLSTHTTHCTCVSNT